MKAILASLQLMLSAAFVMPPKVHGPSLKMMVPVTELEKDLTDAEKTITGVVRRAGPSVAFITSVLPRVDANITSSSPPPGSQSLGSGSGFVVDSDGYCVTNFHVIERAYQLQQTQEQSEKMWNNFVGNITSSCDASANLLNNTSIQPQWLSPPTPRVYCRINSATQYQPCRIVNVQPDLDVAVLKIENSTIADWPTVDFGASSELLVGQSLVAIGNPFGLDQTVTTGVVSALDREIQVSSGQKIRNCIQTDCAINPGNSGGPLLNLQQQVVGVNTAIVTTSGSSAGIGFAIPADKVQPVVRDIIRLDRTQTTRRMGFLGVEIAKHLNGNKISLVRDGSPAAQAGLKGLTIQGSGSVTFGDSICAVGGNFCQTYEQLVQQLDVRVPGEEVAFTVENDAGERRVVYIKLSDGSQ